MYYFTVIYWILKYWSIILLSNPTPSGRFDAASGLKGPQSSSMIKQASVSQQLVWLWCPTPPAVTDTMVSMVSTLITCITAPRYHRRTSPCDKQQQHKLMADLIAAVWGGVQKKCYCDCTAGCLGATQTSRKQQKKKKKKTRTELYSRNHIPNENLTTFVMNTNLDSEP